MIAPVYGHLWCRKASVLLDLTDDSQDDGPVAKQPKLEIGPVAKKKERAVARQAASKLMREREKDIFTKILDKHKAWKMREKDSFTKILDDLQKEFHVSVKPTKAPGAEESPRPTLISILLAEDQARKYLETAFL